MTEGGSRGIIGLSAYRDSKLNGPSWDNGHHVEGTKTLLNLKKKGLRDRCFHSWEIPCFRPKQNILAFLVTTGSDFL
jgi:hypothetical protein